MAIPKAEFPRPDRQRGTWLNLNGQWDFALFPDERRTDMPENWDRQITVPFSWASPLSGVQVNVPGTGFYRRNVEFNAPGRIFLCIGAADYFCDVYVNGALAVSHSGGYNEFDTDVTELWREGANEIVIRCEDMRLESQTYGKQGYGDIQGIWQTVWLEARGEKYIESFRFITHTDGNVELHVNANGGDGDTVTAVFGGKTFNGVIENGKCLINMFFDDPQLWSPESPYLYEGEINLGSDTVSTYFGIREICARDGRIVLNGQPIYINGTLDQAFHPKGHFTYPSDKDMRDEAWRLKRLGLNMARIHIKSEEPRKLYWMDKLGVLIMQDIPCFWGEPDETAKNAYESEWPQEFERDFNHPCIFAWVMFNETWGLFTNTEDGKKYTAETQEWVRSVKHRAAENDPTRLIEDNSPCNYDHVETDINTWHFYINGYEQVKAHIDEICEKTYPGSNFNYTDGNVQGDQPLMNSECGMVWGVDGSAGDSDIAWQYHYMLNEFRLHDKLNGFIFTEFHDVVNEFNGYYRIDDKDKDFGYGAFCRGMSIKDLHADEFIAMDTPPCVTVEKGQVVSVPVALSSFPSGKKGALTAKWELWHMSPYGYCPDMKGEFAIGDTGTGLTRLTPIEVKMPDEGCVAILSVYLYEDGRIVSRNFTTFDVRGAAIEGAIEIAPDSGIDQGFTHRWTALSGDKLCLGGEGSVTYKIPVVGEPSDIDIFIEAGAKRVLTKDTGETETTQDANFMRGYLVDRGAFPNSYWMTDEDKPISNYSVIIDGETVIKGVLTGDNADARGVLSWHYQPKVRALDEAGSYGELIKISVPSRLITAMAERGEFTLTIKADNGLAIYGRNSGRFPVGITVSQI